MYFASLLPRSLRPFARVSLLFFGILPAVSFAQGNTPSALDGFDPNVDGNVYAIAAQPDGRLVIAGAFSGVQPNGAAAGYPRGNIARVNTDGTLDLSFSPNANGAINAVVLQPNGKILIGGTFTTLQPDGTSAAVSRSKLARLNADGSVDASFNPNLGGLPDVQVNALALQADGKVVAGGTFTSAQPNGAAAATTRNRLVRLNSDGSLDASFNPDPNNAVFAIAVQADQKLIVGGTFTSIAGTARNRVARLKGDGSIDATFDPSASSTVSSILVTLDGKIMIGGLFATIQPNGAATTSSHNCIARLNADGSEDITFIGGANGHVATMALQTDGKLLIGGGFTTLWPLAGSGRTESRAYVGRFNADGSLDPTFVPTPNGPSSSGTVVVRAVLAQADGGVVFGGYFTQIKPSSAAFGTIRNHIARVYSNGTPDTALDLGSSGAAAAFAVQPTDGKMLVGGTFATIGGTTRNFLARLNADGSLDAAFNPTINGRITRILAQADGKILIAGLFTTVNGTPRNVFARLTASGALDTDFDPNPNGLINTFAMQSDGKILLGGSFTAFTPNRGTTTTGRNYFARLNADGSLDTAHNTATNAEVLSMGLQSDGKAIIVGAFNAIQVGAGAIVTRNGIARINSDGTLDAGYNPNPNSTISSIALQSDGKAIAVGSFTYVQANSATTSTARNRVARFNTDGSLDPDFNPDANNVVALVAVQSDGKVVLSGALTSVAGHTINGIGRVNSNGTSDFDFDPNPNGRVLALQPLSDGKLLLGGTFSALQPGATGAQVAISRIARLNTNGSIDTSYRVAVGGQVGTQVKTIATQADGKLLVGGNFSDLGGAAGGGLARFSPDGLPDFGFNTGSDGTVNTIVVRPDVGSVVIQGNGFAWVNTDGTLRPGFTTDVNARLIGEVKAVARQSDGKIIIGGVFSNASGVTGSNLARFTASGALDGTFNLNPNGTVNTVVIQGDGKILIGGAFTAIGGFARNHLARFNPDGTIDDSFDPNVGSQVNTLLVQPDGKIVAGGAFTTVGSSATSRAYIARFGSDGSLDTTFSPATNAEIFALARQSDGKIIIGGSFTNVLGSGSTTSSGRLNLARFNSDGTLDTGFDPNHGSGSGPVFAIVVQPDGKIVIGGAFATVGGFQRGNIARMDEAGQLDTGFEIAANSQVNTLALQPDGKILVGGSFTTIAGGTRNRLARLNGVNGSLDLAFNPNANNQVGAIALLDDGSILLGGSFSTLQPGGAIIVGGSFANIGGAALNNLAFLNDDGNANTGFRPNPDGAVNAALVQTDGRIVVGGAFTSIAGATRNRLARLNVDGALDGAFNPNADGAVLALATQSDGKILVGGSFTTIAGAARAGLARLNADGTLDGGFNSGGIAGLGANAIAVQPDGKIIVVRDGSGVRSILSRLNADGSTDGSFPARSTAQIINSVVLQADGKMIVGGAFTSIGGAARNRLARLNSDGSVDSTFDPNADDTVNAIALQQDGKPVIGGAFGRVSDVPRVRVARLAATTPATQSLVAPSSTVVVWTRGGTSPELSSVVFEKSTDGRTWTNLGFGTRVAGTSSWTINAGNLPTSGLFSIRTRGVVPGAQGGSGGLIELTTQLTLQAPVSGSSSPTVAADVTSATTAVGSTDRSFLYAIGALNQPANFAATGLPAGLSIDPMTGIISGTPQQTGTFNVSLLVTNAAGTTTRTLSLTIKPTAALNAGAFAGHLLDISCLAHVDGSRPLITGFVITGSDSKSVLLRAIGPGLASQNVPDILATPRLQVYASDGRLLLDNHGWGGQPSLASVFSQAGEFPLSPASADAAAALTLAPGAYTMVVTDASSTVNGGTVLAEIYDVAGGLDQFAAMSARGYIGVGGSLTGGFVVTGNVPRRLLVRGVGPALVSQGVANALADPLVAVYNMQGQRQARNDNWQTPLDGGASPEDLAAAALSVGDAALASGSKDAALIVTLAPGTYVAQVTGAASSSGSALIEIYELP